MPVDVTVIHESVVTAVQVQAFAELTEIVRPVLASSLSTNSVGLTVKTQPLACEIVVVALPIERAADRAGPGFASTVTETVPFPAPDWPELIVTQDSVVVADQLQSAVVVTAMGVAAPPPAPGRPSR